MTNTVMNEDDDGPAPSWRQRPKPVGFEIGYKLEGETLEVDRIRRVDSKPVIGFFSMVMRRGYGNHVSLIRLMSLIFIRSR